MSSTGDTTATEARPAAVARGTSPTEAPVVVAAEGSAAAVEPPARGKPARRARTRGWLHRFLANPVMNVAVGAAVIVCSLAELISDLEHAGSLRAAHGMILFGLVHGLRAFGDLREGAHELAHPSEEPE